MASQCNVLHCNLVGAATECKTSCCAIYTLSGTVWGSECGRIMGTTALIYEPSSNVINLLSSTARQHDCGYGTEEQCLFCKCAQKINQLLLIQKYSWVVSPLITESSQRAVNHTVCFRITKIFSVTNSDKSHMRR